MILLWSGDSTQRLQNGLSSAAIRQHMQDYETDESFTMGGLLATYPDQRYANFLLTGIKKGLEWL